MKKVHFIGIGGIGMSGLARIMVETGYTISGSDSRQSEVTELLKDLGVDVQIGHREDNIPEGATVVYTTAIKQDNPEWQKVITHKLPKMHRSELLRKLSSEKKMLAVTGTHGKTTTTTMLAALLQEAGFAPTYVIGGIYLKEGTNAKYGEGDYFVAEADESDGTFLNYHPYGAIVTNIDDDHLDHFGSFERLEQAFGQFMDQVHNKQCLLWCYDNLPLRRLNKAGISYGYEEGADCQATNFRVRGFASLVDIHFKGVLYKDVEIRMIGKPLCLNAVAVFALAMQLGCQEASIRRSLASFAGVKRRREVKNSSPDFLVLDDYGHHPTEIRVTIHAVKEAVSSRRVVVLFQPHRYSRTKLCFEGFKTAFDKADLVILTDLYAAGESAIDGISSEALAAALGVQHLKKESLVQSVLPLLQKGDVIITMGAGDITAKSDELAQYL